MKKWNVFQISFFTLLCILLDCAGRIFAAECRLPLWIDSFGTVLSAYIGGPVAGCIVGITANLIYGIMNHVSYIYSLTSIALAVIVGIAAKRNALNHFFGTMSVSVLATLFSIVISVPLNILYYGGYTGNMWGDGVILPVKTA